MSFFNRYNLYRKVAFGLIVCLIAFCSSLNVSHVQMAEGGKAAVFSGKDWERIEKPESAGYSSARLQALRGWLQSLDTTAMMVSVGGRSLFEYGDMTRQSYLASVRKSILAILFGKYVENGKIQLDKTMRELEFTDVGGLSPREQEATIEHLISARSGVYHPASNPGDFTGSAPPRNSQRPEIGRASCRERV